MSGRIYFPPHVWDDPRQMPEFRRGLLDMANEGGHWEVAESYRALHELAGNLQGRTHAGITTPVETTISGPEGYSAKELPIAVECAAQRVMNQMKWCRQNIADAQLIHVSSDLSDILFASVESIPDDTVLDWTSPPVPAGLVVFQTPFYGIDSGEHYDLCRVDAVLWGPVNLPPWDRYRLNEVTGSEGGRPGTAMFSFRWMDMQSHDDPAAADLRARAVDEGVDWEHDADYRQSTLLPLGRADWANGAAVTDPLHAGVDPESKAHLSMIEDRRLMSALWALIKSKRIVESTTVTATRAASKRLDRRGDTTSREVEVVHLRRREYLPTHADGETGRRVGVRFAVKPHWRNQAHGPNHSLRKLILVPPHMRGPEDAPLSGVERVWSVDS